MLNENENVEPPMYGIPPDLVIHEDVGVMSPQTWHLPRDVFRKVRDISKGKGIKVAVLDTGYKSHSTLPVPVAQRSFINGESVVDKHSHGTHVSGTVLSRDEDIGLAPEADLIVGKVLSNRGSGSSSGIAAGVRWATDQGADIINMSLGGSSPYQPTINAIKRAMDRGVIVCIAAGNSGFSGRGNTIGWPARSGEGVCVAALKQDFTPASFSSGGLQLTIAAPGQQILSCGLNNNFVYMSGTCVAEGSYVYGPDGPCKIENVKAGDSVYAYQDGRRVERIVSNTWNRGTNNVINVSAGGRDVTVTETHEMLCVNTKEKDIQWVSSKDINPDYHRMVIPKEMPNNINPYLDRIVDNDFAYLLGYLIGDGWISETTRSKRVCVAEDGKEHVMNHVAKLYKKLVGKSLKMSKGRWLYDDSTMFALILEASGLQGGSVGKTLPFWVWHLSQSKQDSILNGYFAADAHNKKLGGFSLETVSEDLVRRIACLSDYRGWSRGAVRSRLRNIMAPNSTQPTNKPTYMLYSYPYAKLRSGFSSVFHDKNIDKMYKKIRDMGIEPNEFALCKPRIKDNPNTLPVYDLTVPGADNFITHGTVTHNSMATPYTAGAWALILSHFRSLGKPSMTGVEAVNEFVKLNAKDLLTPGHDPHTGHGMFDMLSLMTKLSENELKFI